MYQDDEFEQFLQNEVKQHRMYPSDHIWNNIRTQIHGYRAWPALTFISLFIITALTLSTLLNNHPDSHLIAAENMDLNKQPANTQPGQAGKTVSGAEKNTRYFQKIAPEQITAETFADLKQDDLVVDEASNYTPVSKELISQAHTISNSDKPAIKTNTNSVTLTVPKPIRLQANPSVINTENSILLAETDIESYASAGADGFADLNSIAASKRDARKNDNHASADEFFKDFNFISNVEPRNRNSKFGFQFYITPSSSYRQLSDQRVKDIIQPAIIAAAATQNVPVSLNTANVNQVVRQKPGVGFEVGFGLLYNITKNLKFKTGLQLNMRQYYIETFETLTNDLSSLSLINYRGVETISFYSPYNNNTGYRNAQLDNRLYQLSVPLGFQYESFQSKHFSLVTEATVQSTLTLNTNTFLLSTDYKHYTPGNDLVRKWNINTTVGFSISYKTGSTQFMVGPQLRYQHLPTYSNLYPIKEYLTDFGIRFGITKQIK